MSVDENKSVGVEQLRRSSINRLMLTLYERNFKRLLYLCKPLTASISNQFYEDVFKDGSSKSALVVRGKDQRCNADTWRGALNIHLALLVSSHLRAAP